MGTGLSMPWSGAECCDKTHGKIFSFPLAWLHLSLSRHCCDALLHYVQTYQNELVQGTRLETNTLSDPSLCEEKTDCGHIPDTVSIFSKASWSSNVNSVFLWSPYTGQRLYWHKLHKLHKPLKLLQRIKNNVPNMSKMPCLCIPTFRAWNTISLHFLASQLTKHRAKLWWHLPRPRSNSIYSIQAKCTISKQYFDVMDIINTY